MAPKQPRKEKQQQQEQETTTAAERSKRIHSERIVSEATTTTTSSHLSREREKFNRQQVESHISHTNQYHHHQQQQQIALFQSLVASSNDMSGGAAGGYVTTNSTMAATLHSTRPFQSNQQESASPHQSLYNQFFATMQPEQLQIAALATQFANLNALNEAIQKSYSRNFNTAVGTSGRTSRREGHLGLLPTTAAGTEAAAVAASTTNANFLNNINHQIGLDFSLQQRLSQASSNIFGNQAHHQLHFSSGDSIGAPSQPVQLSTGFNGSNKQVPQQQPQQQQSVQIVAPNCRASASGGSGRRRRGTRKCRKTYGMAQRQLWCTQCKWKKACSRFSPSQQNNRLHNQTIETSGSRGCVGEESSNPTSHSANNNEQHFHLLASNYLAMGNHHQVATVAAAAAAAAAAASAHLHPPSAHKQ